MTKRQRLAVEQSERRQKLNDLLGLDTLSDEQRGEMETLTKRLQEIEVETRAAILAEPDPTETRTDPEGPEGRELRALQDRADVGAIFEAAIEKRDTEGAERELQAHYKLGNHQVPVALLEQRAVTPAPANVEQAQDTIVPAVFPMGAAAFCGVMQPTVEAGERVYPVLTNNAAADDVDEASSVTETTGSFSADVLTPRRIQASFFYSREDRAKFPGMDAALRMNLSDALSSGLDKYVVAKTDVGLVDFGTDPTAPSTESDFAGYRAAIYGALDGRYASQAIDACLLVGAATYAHAAGVYRSNNADDSALDSLTRVSGGVRISAHVPAKASMIQQAVVCRGKQYRHAVAPIWDGIQLIPDEVTKAATGEIVLTAVMLMAFKVIRTDGFVRVSFHIG